MTKTQINPGRAPQTFWNLFELFRAFFEKNKAYYDIEGALSNTKDSKITILKDVTNEKIHKKAVNAIIKSIKSSRKFKFELAS